MKEALGMQGSQQQSYVSSPRDDGRNPSGILRVDSSDDFQSIDGEEVRQLRQQRVTAALENLQLEREVAELKNQLNAFDGGNLRPPNAIAHRSSLGRRAQRDYDNAENFPRQQDERWRALQGRAQQQHWPQKHQQQYGEFARNDRAAQRRLDERGVTELPQRSRFHNDAPHQNSPERRYLDEFGRGDGT